MIVSYILHVLQSIWVRVVKKTPGQNTPEKTLQVKFIEEEVPLNNLQQTKCNYLQISVGVT